MKRSRWFACAIGLSMLGLAMPQGAQREQQQQQRQQQEERQQPQQRQQEQQQAQQRSMPADFTPPAGAGVEQLNEARQIRNTLAGAVYQIVTDDEMWGRTDVVDFEGMVDYLARPDRARIGTPQAEELRQLTETVQELRNQWQKKFQADIEAIDADQVFADLQLWEGRIEDPATFAAHWPVAMGRSASPSGQQPPAERTEPPPQAERDRPAPGGRQPAEPQGRQPEQQQARQPGQRTEEQPGEGYYRANNKIAVARVEGDRGADAITISFTNEMFDRWRIDVPDQVAAANVIRNLEQRLGDFGKNASQWPSDVNAAYRHLAQEVFKALYGDQSRARTE